MGATLAMLSNFFLFSQIQDGCHIGSVVSKMAIKSLFLYQVSSVIYHFFQTFILYYMVKQLIIFLKFKMVTIINLPKIMIMQSFCEVAMTCRCSLLLTKFTLTQNSEYIDLI